MQQGSDDDRKLIRNAILEGGLDQLDRITAIIESTGALEYTANKAREAADLAIQSLAGLPASEFKQALVTIAELSIQRRS
jgi:octaprenyl-diphosphate synthase